MQVSSDARLLSNPPAKDSEFLTADIRRAAVLVRPGMRMRPDGGWIWRAGRSLRSGGESTGHLAFVPRQSTIGKDSGKALRAAESDWYHIRNLGGLLIRRDDRRVSRSEPGTNRGSVGTYLPWLPAIFNPGNLLCLLATRETEGHFPLQAARRMPAVTQRRTGSTDNSTKEATRSKEPPANGPPEDSRITTAQNEYVFCLAHFCPTSYRTSS